MLLVLSCPAIAGGAAGLSNPVVTPVEVLSAGGGSRSTAPEALRDCPPLFELDPPPLIALEPRLFAPGVSTALVVPRVLRFTRTYKARRWPSARLLPRPSRRSLRKPRDGTSVGPSSFGRGRCVGLVLTRNLVQYNYSSLVWLHADRLHENQNTDRELIYF